MKNFYNSNGITVQELKEIVDNWSIENTNTESLFFGERCTVWIDNLDGTSNMLKSISVLNKKIDIDGNVFSDMLLSS